jgi:hypothetical protein
MQGNEANGMASNFSFSFSPSLLPLLAHYYGHNLVANGFTYLIGQLNTIVYIQPRK